MSTYLIINLLAVAMPLALSFDRKVAFWKKWRFAFPAILIPAALFIVWDIYFTGLGVWSFNPAHLSGATFFNLPLEECLFFIAIPYATLFTYEVIKVYFGSFFSSKWVPPVTLLLIVVLAFTGIIFISRLYTGVTFLSSAVVLAILYFFSVHSFLKDFYPSYLITLLPFLLVNGILTGTFLHEPVVIYNNTENLGIRILTIPLEDSVYGFLLMLMNVWIFEYLQKRSKVAGALPEHIAKDSK